MDSLKKVLGEVGQGLKKKEKVREDAYESMRKATSLSKQTILLIHQKRLIEAKSLIRKAQGILSKLGEASTLYPDIIYCGSYSAALQEYAEANIFLKLVEESKFVTPSEINVPPVDYVLGLADVIGECRRLVLDALREGDMKKGERFLKTMDDIYIELMAMDESYMLVTGLRRKCDVARKIIEITRGDITQEIRRDILEKHLKQFEKYANTLRKDKSKAC
jgi:translin